MLSLKGLADLDTQYFYHWHACFTFSYKMRVMESPFFTYQLAVAIEVYL